MPSHERPARPTLIAAAIGAEPPAEVTRRLIAEDEMPDILMIGDALNGVDLKNPAPRPPGWRGRVLARVPAPVAEVWLRRREVGAVLSWGENIALPVAALMCVMPRPRPGHVAILMVPFHEARSSSWKRRVKRAVVACLVRRGIDRVNVPAPLQRRWAGEHWNLPPGRFVDAQWPVDTSFWRPMDGPGDLICAVGRERRDYATLVEALRPLKIRCHIAAGTAVYYGGFGSLDPRAANAGGEELPDTITVGAKSLPELRELYARSRFVVVPILPSISDNGISTVMEAMAMGRAVISTQTAGRPDILRHEINCLLVPPQDPGALRRAIEQLWNDADLCARLGANARHAVVEAHGLDHWLSHMLAAIHQVAQPSPGSPGGVPEPGALTR
jgi:glycosyltransferase involved in cell wall biosynthesis